ncbi:hypothetical protein [Flavobacterium sp.]|uniref:hypothetical protein n=1 Tax=Flavobacterium sp. TaxID=239 RepID=UPI0026241B7D|nr:hypothetical protein [Flavobacterium sp.]
MNASKNKLTFLKIFLVLQVLLVLVYTGLTINNAGWSLFHVFINDILAVSWNGQFNIDFSSYLVLSGVWILWRNKFSSKSIFLALAAAIIGFIVFGSYLLYLSIKEKGDVTRILVGEN